MAHSLVCFLAMILKPRSCHWLASNFAEKALITYHIHRYNIMIPYSYKMKIHSRNKIYIIWTIHTYNLSFIMINDMLWQLNAKTEFLIHSLDLSCKSMTTNKNRQITSTIRDHFTNNWNSMKIHTLLSIKSLKPEQDKWSFSRQHG